MHEDPLPPGITTVELLYLPSDSPELNADELRNCDRKQRVTTAAPEQAKPALTRTAEPSLRSIQKQTQRFRS